MKSNKTTFLLVIIALIGLSFNATKAQFVTIPDGNFVTWLNTNYPSCMNGNQMDTTCAQIIYEDSIYLQYTSIYDLEGIQYFDSLKVLASIGNYNSSLPRLPSTLISLSVITGLTSLPALPNSLEVLNCSANVLTTLPALPNSLQILNCAYNRLTSLPMLPSSLMYLTCNDQQNGFQITALPTLPPSLVYLKCRGNAISILPNLPTNLAYLDVEFNDLTSLPMLPLNLKYLNCGANLLNQLPALPIGLDTLWCGSNQLIHLPALPNTLKELSCYNNQLIDLPSLPNSLQTISCLINNISVCPTLPNSLQTLDMNTNSLSSLPSLPNTLKYLDIANNNITNCLPYLPSSLWFVSFDNFLCIPNSLNDSAFNFTGTPLCTLGDTVNNPFNCINLETHIIGSPFQDNNNDCIRNVTDSMLKNIPVKFYNTINNQFGMTNSDLNGYFNYSCQPGTYFVSIDTLNKPYTVSCNYPGIDTLVTTSLVNPVVDFIDFEIKSKPITDLSVQAITNTGIVFPGTTHVIKVVAGDVLNWFGLNSISGVSGQIQLTITGPLNYSGNVSGSLAPVISGNTYTFNIADFASYANDGGILLSFQTQTTAQGGDQVCVHAEISSSIAEFNPLNNIKDYCYTVVNSYDPNYKEVYPIDVEPGFEDWLTYTIHFQNTGTAPAINIKLLDTLDINLDKETFEVINYSHYNTVTLMNGVLDFRFPNILLPDSATDLTGSQGFVQYRIKPLANLPIGTQIENTAQIYFDYNAPITTNTTVNNFITTVALNEKMQSPNILIYPNPSTGLFNLSAKANLEIYNIIGELISTINNTETIDLSNEPNGIYFVKLNGTTVKKLIKK
jgi:hypothetical protein